MESVTQGGRVTGTALAGQRAGRWGLRVWLRWEQEVEGVLVRGAWVEGTPGATPEPQGPSQLVATTAGRASRCRLTATPGNVEALKKTIGKRTQYRTHCLDPSVRFCDARCIHNGVGPPPFSPGQSIFPHGRSVPVRHPLPPLPQLSPAMDSLSLRVCLLQGPRVSGSHRTLLLWLAAFPWHNVLTGCLGRGRSQKSFLCKAE